MSESDLPPSPPLPSSAPIHRTSPTLSSSPQPRLPPGLPRSAAIGKKTRSMRLNLSSNSVQFDTSTILEDFLYLGAKGVTGDREKLDGLNIGFIVNCTQDAPVEYPDAMAYFHVDVGDFAGDDIGRFFPGACEFIEKARVEGKSCLVHCTMGMSRSTSIVLAYLVKHQGMSLAQALVHVKERRPVSSPNAGFMAQLVQYEVKVRGKATIDAEKYATNRFADVAVYAVV